MARVKVSEQERVFPSRVAGTHPSYTSWSILQSITPGQRSLRSSEVHWGESPCPLRGLCLCPRWQYSFFPTTSTHLHFECRDLAMYPPPWYITLALLLPGLVPLSPFSDWLAAHYCVSTQCRIVIDALPVAGTEEGTILSLIQNGKTVIAFG